MAIDRARYAGVAMSHNGVAVVTEPYAQIKLYVSGTGTPTGDDGTALSDTVYAAASGGTTLTNPFFADVDGNFVFYLTDAKTVKLVATGPTIGTLVRDYEPVLGSPGQLPGAWVGDSLVLHGNETNWGEVTGTSSFKGGMNLTSQGSLMIGKQAASGDVTSATIVVNRESTSRDGFFVPGAVAPFGDEVMVNFDFLNRSKGSDSGSMTIHCGEGDLDGYNAAGHPGGPASALRAIEIRPRFATYSKAGAINRIVRGHGNYRRGIGLGFQTQTASTSVDGTTAGNEAAIEANFDGRGAFPAASTNPDGVMGDTCILTGGYNGAKWHLYGMKPGGASITDPVYAIDQYGRIGSNVFPSTTAQMHVKRHGSVAGGTDFVHLIESDNSSAVPNQGRIRGESDTTKHLDYGYNTTSNYGGIDAHRTVAAVVTGMPLVLNANGGAVHIAPDTSKGTGRLVVFSLSGNGANSGIKLVKNNDTNKFGELYMDTSTNGMTVKTSSTTSGTQEVVVNLNPANNGVGLQVIRNTNTATGDLFQVVEGGVAVRLNLTTAGILNLANATPANAGYAVNGTKVVGAQGTAVAAVAGTAAGTDAAVINEIKARFNELRAQLSTSGGGPHGLIP